MDFIYDSISKVIEESSISYIKWDMNRYMSEPFSRGASAADQGKTMHKYILGVYELYTRLTERFPDILFESCASGGARFDPGMLYFAPQTWTSDDTDAAERERFSTVPPLFIRSSAWDLMYQQYRIISCTVPHRFLQEQMWHISEPLAMSWI